LRKTDTGVHGAFIITPDFHLDDRGYFTETFSYRRLSALGINARIFVQGNESGSRRGTLRGLHYQLEHPQAKLCWVSRGEVLDVIVDIRVGSPTFGEVALTHLTANQPHRCTVFVPRGCAHGFLALGPVNIFNYLCDDEYAPSDSHGIIWNDPRLAIPWKTGVPVLSEKDAAWPTLHEAREQGLLPLFHSPA
jgi:dTDP-4-dehydrorhamnose 3,5-epimerase